MFGELIHELTGPLVPTVLPGVQAVHAVDWAGVHPLLLAIGSERYVPYAAAAERRPMELLTQANAILGQGQMSLAKYLFIATKDDAPGLDIDDVGGFLMNVLSRFDPARDRMTAALIKATLARQRPVFGVCRGFQELNIAFGGTLRRDTSRSPDLLAHHAPDDAAFDAMFDHSHPVSLTPGGLLHGAYGRDALTVSSVHFQGVGRLGQGLQIEAQAPDGIIEAVSTRVGGAPVLAVQWHPEWDADRNADSATFFHLLGRALRGDPLLTEGPP